MVKEPTNRVFAKNLVELRLLQSVSCIKPIPTHEKHLLWEKVAPTPLMTYQVPGIFSWDGSALGWGFCRLLYINVYIRS